MNNICDCGHEWSAHNENGCCWDEDCTCIKPSILEMVKEARRKLQATQENWQEECLFECDAILVGIIRTLEEPEYVWHKETKLLQS